MILDDMVKPWEGLTIVLIERTQLPDGQWIASYRPVVDPAILKMFGTGRVTLRQETLQVCGISSYLQDDGSCASMISFVTKEPPGPHIVYVIAPSV